MKEGIVLFVDSLFDKTNYLHFNAGMLTEAVQTFVECYPRVFHACHGRHVVDPAAKKVLSQRQASVLDHLDLLEPIHLDQLCRHMGIKASGMSLMIERLVEGGYVRRTPDERDARRVKLRLTRAGARIKAQQKVLDPDRVGDLLKRLDPQQQRQAVAALAELARAADEMLAARVDRGPARQR
jgi:DNA-binding MarR family transcriptional regulator